jgi:chlorite dismutase
MVAPLSVTFTAGPRGDWRIERLAAVTGESLPAAPHLSFRSEAAQGAESRWQLRGIVSNTRYTTAEELKRLNAVSPPLGRPEATCAALIPIRKSDAWWSMAQDQRRAIFEERSGHIAMSMSSLPAIARRLHHARDLGEPFDFLTWFEYAPQHTNAFEELVAELRASEEWHYVEREVDIRLIRAS